MDSLGERLKILRKSRKLTQKQVAIDISSGERSYQGYEANERKPLYDVLISLANYFDVSLDYLVGRSDIRERR